MGPKNLIQRWTKNIFGFYRFTFEVDPFKEHAWLWLSKKKLPTKMDASKKPDA